MKNIITLLFLFLFASSFGQGVKTYSETRCRVDNGEPILVEYSVENNALVCCYDDMTGQKITPCPDYVLCDISSVTPTESELCYEVTDGSPQSRITLKKFTYQSAGGIDSIIYYNGDVRFGTHPLLNDFYEGKCDLPILLEKECWGAKDSICDFNINQGISGATQGLQLADGSFAFGGIYFLNSTTGQAAFETDFNNWISQYTTSTVIYDWSNANINITVEESTAPLGGAFLLPQTSLDVFTKSNCLPSEEYNNVITIQKGLYKNINQDGFVKDTLVVCDEFGKPIVFDSTGLSRVNCDDILAIDEGCDIQWQTMYGCDTETGNPVWWKIGTDCEGATYYPNDSIEYYKGTDMNSTDCYTYESEPFEVYTQGGATIGNANTFSSWRAPIFYPPSSSSVSNSEYEANIEKINTAIQNGCYVVLTSMQDGFPSVAVVGGEGASVGSLASIGNSINTSNTALVSSHIIPNICPDLQAELLARQLAGNGSENPTTDTSNVWKVEIICFQNSALLNPQPTIVCVGDCPPVEVNCETEIIEVESKYDVITTLGESNCVEIQEIKEKDCAGKEIYRYVIESTISNELITYIPVGDISNTCPDKICIIPANIECIKKRTFQFVYDNGRTPLSSSNDCGKAANLVRFNNIFTSQGWETGAGDVGVGDAIGAYTSWSNQLLGWANFGIANDPYNSTHTFDFFGAPTWRGWTVTGCSPIAQYGVWTLQQDDGCIYELFPVLYTEEIETIWRSNTMDCDGNLLTKYYTQNADGETYTEIIAPSDVDCYVSCDFIFEPAVMEGAESVCTTKEYTLCDRVDPNDSSQDVEFILVVTSCEGQKTVRERFTLDSYNNATDPDELITYVVVGDVKVCGSDDGFVEPLPACNDFLIETFYYTQGISEGTTKTSWENLNLESTDPNYPPDNDDAAICEYIDGFDTSQTPTTPATVLSTGFQVNDIGTAGNSNDYEITKSWLKVTEPVYIRWTGTSEGSIKVFLGFCEGELEEQFCEARFGDPASQAIYLPIGLHEYEIINFDHQGTNSSYNAEYSIDGVNYTLDNTPPMVTFSTTKPYEVCVKVKACKDTGANIDFLTGLEIDLDGYYTCSVACNSTGTSTTTSTISYDAPQPICIDTTGDGIGNLQGYRYTTTERNPFTIIEDIFIATNGDVYNNTDKDLTNNFIQAPCPCCGE